MKIIKTLLVLCILIALQTSANALSPSGKRVNPNGDIKTKTFNIPSSSYERISVSSFANVNIVEGTEDIVVKIDSNLAPYLVVKVSEGELKIELEGASSRSGKFTFEVVVSYSGELNGISASGASTVNSEVVLTGGEISLMASGASDIFATVEGGECNVRASGSSDIEVKCTSETLMILALGSSDISAKLKIGKCEIRASGSSDIYIQGEANDVELSASGSSDIYAKGLKYKTINVDKSGASNVSY